MREQRLHAAQLAAWVLAQKESVAPIPGTKQMKLQEESVDARNVCLTEVDLGSIDRTMPPGAVERTTAPQMQALNR